MGKVNPKVEEAIETLNMKDGPTRRRLLQGTGLVSATAAASALLAACASSGTASSGSSSSAAASAAGNFPKTPPWKFVFVNHVTTNPFFVPTQYGLQDAAALLGIPKPSWTGSANSNVPQMVSAMQSGISAGANGIAVAVISATGTNRLAYIGQDLFASGQALGQRIVAAPQMANGGNAVGFIATPGASNIQPRIDGAKSAIKASGKGINFTSVTSGAELPQENTTINAYILAHKSSLKGIFAVDAGSTQTVGAIIKKYSLQGKVASGGFDLTPQTLSSIKGGFLDFTIDQQPYLQGFLPFIALFMFNLSGGLVAPAETNTGLTFVTKANVGPYQNTTSRFEGSSTSQKLISRSGPIA